MEKNVINGQLVNRGNNSVLDVNNPRFYTLMHYPVPCFPRLFWKWENEGQGSEQIEIKVSCFSWEEKTPLLVSFLQEVSRYEKTYRSLPFVDLIFLCNSISFNALHKDSDIDFFMVTSPKRVWTARFFSSLVFFLMGIKRSSKTIVQKFCLSFFVDWTAADLSDLRIWNDDVYLTYWTAHLVPIYESYRWQSSLFYEKNKWIQEYLSIPILWQQFFLWNEVFIGSSLFKRFLEFLLGGRLGDAVEAIIRWFWSKRIRYLNKKYGTSHADVFISDSILKFHKDIRVQVSNDFLWYDNQ